MSYYLCIKVVHQGFMLVHLPHHTFNPCKVDLGMERLKDPMLEKKKCTTTPFSFLPHMLPTLCAVVNI